jgi:hypothetical protein
MMKKIILRAIFFYFIILGSLIISADDPTVVSDDEIGKIQDDINTYVPINGEGEFDPTEMKSKAELRIEKINEYVGQITNFFWGVELSLTWIFVFSVVVWIILIELIVMPVSELFKFNVLGSLVIAFIIATLAMQGFGQNFVVWMNSIAESWKAAAMALVFMVIFAIIYSFIMKYFGKKIDKWKKEADEERLMKDRDVIHAEAKVADKA